MGTSRTGVPGDLAVFLVRVVFKCDLVTAPTHHRSTMALIAKDLATKRSLATHSLAQLMVTILSGLIGLNAVQRAVMALRRVTDPASIPHRPTVAVTARALEI